LIRSVEEWENTLSLGDDRFKEIGFYLLVDAIKLGYKDVIEMIAKSVITSHTVILVINVLLVKTRYTQL